MKFINKQFLIVLFLTISISSFSQKNSTDDLTERFTREISLMKSSIDKQNTQINSLNNNLSELRSQIETLDLANDSLRISLAETNAELDSTRNQLKVSSDSLENSILMTNDNLEASKSVINSSISNRTLLGIIAIALTLFVALILYIVLRKRISYSENSLTAIKNAQAKLSEESIKLDNQLVELMNKQLDVQKQLNTSVNKTESTSTTEPDHSLALKVADEIVRIEINLSRMDPTIKGYKQLSKAIERMKDNFIANGYELVDMLGKEYNEGMRVFGDFIIDESLPLGSRIITSIKKPQVNYNGQMIQKATITISQNI